MPALAPRPLAFLVLLLSSALPGVAQDRAPTGDGVRGREVYARHCLECHGDKGRGDGPTAKRLKFRARDLAHGSFKCRCTPSGGLPTDDDLARTIRQGIAGTPMTGFGDTLSGDELAAVVHYIKSFSPRFAKSPSPECITVPDPPPATPELVADGRRVYAMLQCGKCHGATGRGDGPAASGLQDDWGDPVKPGRFGASGQFKCGGEARDLWRTLHTGLNGAPMPSYADAFLFPREAGRDLRDLERLIGAEATADLRRWLESQPDAAGIAAMADGDKQRLTEARAWALVHFLRSKPGA